jgi:UPF0716 protein FxsA
MRFVLGFGSVLALPVLEAWLLFRLGDRFGIWVVAWLVAAALCGVLLIRFEKLVWALRLATSLREQRSPLKALLASARSVIAGVLLIFPGVLTDVLAVLLLLWPLPASTEGGGGSGGDRGPGVIEGEFRREHHEERLPPGR